MSVDRLTKLKILESKLFESLEDAAYNELPSLAKQYRDTLREIEALEGNVKEDDEISKLLGRREAAGKPRAVRKSRTKVQRD